MSKIFCISYDFRNQPAPDFFPAFGEALQGLGNWWHYLTDTWLIATDLTAEEIFARLEPFIGTQLYILIAELGTDFSGWLPRDACEWIRAQRKETVEHNHLQKAAGA